MESIQIRAFQAATYVIAETVAELDEWPMENRTVDGFTHRLWEKLDAFLVSERFERNRVEGLEEIIRTVLQSFDHAIQRASNAPAPGEFH